MEIKIIKHYAEDDPKFMKDCIIDFIVDEKMVYEGEDYYHHNIEEKIEGFKDCLRFLNINFKTTTTKLSDCSDLND